jgi:hypothetical protein
MIAHRLGISVAEYDRLIEGSGGLCALCGESYGERPNVDHCHKTGKVRGVLCSRCNTGIGLFAESPELFNAAVRYLACFSSDPASGSTIVKTRGISDR